MNILRCPWKVSTGQEKIIQYGTCLVCKKCLATLFYKLFRILGGLCPWTSSLYIVAYSDVIVIISASFLQNDMLMNSILIKNFINYRSCILFMPSKFNASKNALFSQRYLNNSTSAFSSLHASFFSETHSLYISGSWGGGGGNRILSLLLCKYGEKLLKMLFCVFNYHFSCFRLHHSKYSSSSPHRNYYYFCIDCVFTPVASSCSHDRSCGNEYPKYPRNLVRILAGTVI